MILTRSLDIFELQPYFIIKFMHKDVWKDIKAKYVLITAVVSGTWKKYLQHV